MRNGIKNYDSQFSTENLEERFKVIDFVNKVIDQNPKKKTWELMKIAKTGVIKKKTASRKISRLTKKINQL